MRVITPAAFKVYTFNELPKNVQSAVLDANRFILTDEDYWYDFIYDDFQNVIAPLFGIEVGLDDKVRARGLRGVGSRRPTFCKRSPNTSHRTKRCRRSRARFRESMRLAKSVEMNSMRR
jgi:hypothetical protein